MFGYIEKSYVVLDEFAGELKKDGQVFKKKVEVRIPERESSLINSEIVHEYIAIEGYTENDNMILDLLLIYKNNTLQDMYDDFENLKNKTNIDLNNLKCFDWISGHHVGFSRSGARRMY